MVPLLTPSVITITPQEGQAIWVLGDHYTIKVTGEETQGGFPSLNVLFTPAPEHRRTCTILKRKRFIFWKGLLPCGRGVNNS